MYSVALANIDTVVYVDCNDLGHLFASATPVSDSTGAFRWMGVRSLGSLWSLRGRIPSAGFKLQFALALKVSHVL